MELNLIARSIDYYSINLIKLDKLESVIETILFEFQMSGYFKYDFLIYNYKKEGCYLTYYEGVDTEDKIQAKLECKSKITTLTYPTTDKKDFLFQIEVINLLSKKFSGHIYDPKAKKVITASQVKFLI
ncbi:MAG: hypothetical protein H7263_12305 [Candidatus Sericytochromatia bacterium]|nr:hypothetical protein [Candidatus Sericytochromatia bacterium]